MRIQEIEIDNFKSFKNQTKIPILSGFTAIAGPNGSGKSNIIDSILFCLGLSSSRTLRAEKLTDLINNTTSRREARVSIRLGEDQKDSPEAESLEVGRRIRENESGYQSTYYLNGKPSTLSEIHDRLALHNVTPNGYNVVMQGDVTRIISMTGFERRKILDELAGVAEFDARVNSAHAELEKVNESHERFGLILDEIANRLIQLQAERDQAIRYKKLSDEKVQCEAASKLAACWELKQKVLGLADMIASAQERSAGIGEKLAAAKELLAEKKAAHEALNEEIRQKGGAELLEVQDALEEARAGMEREKAAATYLLSQRNELARQEAKSEEERARAEQKKEELSVQLAELEERQARYQKDLEAARAEYERLQEAIMAIYAENEATSKKASELRIRLNEAKDRANEVYRKRMQAEEASLRVGERVSEQKDQLKHHREALQALEGEAARFEEDSKKNQGQLNALEEELKDLFGQKQWARNVLAETEGEAEEARIHFHRIEAQLKAADESSFGRAVETVLKSGMQGIHGTLAQLGSAEDRYSHALEVAGGGKLRFIVCDDDGVASRGISLLKERRAGRATFLPLNKLSPERSRQPVEKPGFLGYAIDLLSFDDQYRDAFAFAFGETLVVDTIEHARPHIGKYRMVTLEGDLLERSGAMTGGSDGKAALRFTSSLQREYEEAKVNLASALKELAKRKEELSTIESQIEGTRFKKEKQSEALRFLQLEAADRKRRIGETSVEIGRIETALASSKEEEKQYKSQIESYSKQMLKDDELLNELELELSDLEDSLAESQLGE
ncbi:MAG: AAA family ATPase, partial [Bacteroidota bacterium]